MEIQRWRWDRDVAWKKKARGGVVRGRVIYDRALKYKEITEVARWLEGGSEGEGVAVALEQGSNGSRRLDTGWSSAVLRCSKTALMQQRRGCWQEKARQMLEKAIELDVEGQGAAMQGQACDGAMWGRQI